jgi:hypothetical protein
MGGGGLLVSGCGPKDLGKQAPGGLFLIKLRRFDETGSGERRQPVEETVQSAVLPLGLSCRPEVSQHSREEAGEVMARLDVARVNVGGSSSLVLHCTMLHGAARDYMFIGPAPDLRQIRMAVRAVITRTSSVGLRRPPRRNRRQL